MVVWRCVCASGRARRGHISSPARATWQSGRWPEASELPDERLYLVFVGGGGGGESSLTSQLRAHEQAAPLIAPSGQAPRAQLRAAADAALRQPLSLNFKLSLAAHPPGEAASRRRTKGLRVSRERLIGASRESVLATSSARPSQRYSPVRQEAASAARDEPPPTVVSYFASPPI